MECITLTICKSINSLTGTLVNSEDPDKMSHNVAFPQVLHSFLDTTKSS